MTSTVDPLHDPASALVEDAHALLRACERQGEGESTLAPVIAHRIQADGVRAGHRDGDMSWFKSSRSPIGQAG